VSVVFQIARVGVLSGRREPFLLAIIAVSFDANGGIGGALAKVIRAAARSEHVVEFRRDKANRMPALR
jgi:hypothetical protein